MPASYANHRAQLKAILLGWGMPEDNAEITAEDAAWDIEQANGRRWSAERFSPEMVEARRRPLMARLAEWLKSLGVEELAAVSTEVAEHRGTLDRLAERAERQMTEAEESLYAELVGSGSSAWAQLQGTVTSQLTATVHMPDGTSVEHPMTVVRGMATHEDAEVRKAAYEAELEAWPKVTAVCAAAMNGVKGETDADGKESADVDEQRGAPPGADHPERLSSLERREDEWAAPVGREPPVGEPPGRSRAVEGADLLEGDAGPSQRIACRYLRDKVARGRMHIVSSRVEELCDAPLPLAHHHDQPVVERRRVDRNRSRRIADREGDAAHRAIDLSLPGGTGERTAIVRRAIQIPGLERIRFGRRWKESESRRHGSRRVAALRNLTRHGSRRGGDRNGNADRWRAALSAAAQPLFQLRLQVRLVRRAFEARTAEERPSFECVLGARCNAAAAPRTGEGGDRAQRARLSAALPRRPPLALPPCP